VTQIIRSVVEGGLVVPPTIALIPDYLKPSDRTKLQKVKVCLSIINSDLTLGMSYYFLKILISHVTQIYSFQRSKESVL